jgi:hypothetical protein
VPEILSEHVDVVSPAKKRRKATLDISEICKKVEVSEFKPSKE